MPELPEVEVVRHGLEPAVTNALITSVDVLDTRSLKRHDHRRGEFSSLLTGTRIRSAVRRGKFLWFPLASGDALVAHLGMSGQLLLREPGVDDRQTRIRLGIEHAEHGELVINFADQRIFGAMAVDTMLPTTDGLPSGFAGSTQAAAAIPSQVAHIARDPLDPAFDAVEFAERLRRRHTSVKRALLDQTLVSGIGNIYADEALWAAGIHFDQDTSRLSLRRIGVLLGEVRQVLRKALAEGGTSFDAQYVNVNGQAGFFRQSLNVYGLGGRPCKRCGTSIVREKFMNRSSHFCPVCQRKR